jgi:adenylate kinase family enzyme
MFMIGSKKSGKTSLGEHAAQRTNFKLMNLRDFIKEKGLKGKDDEAITQELINSLYYEIEPRIMMEDFP